MSDSYIQVPPDSTGKKTDCEELLVGANTVQRQRIQIAGTDAADVAPVSATEGLKVQASALGATGDAAVTTDAAGTVSGKLRGLVAHMVSLLTRFPTTLLNGRFQVVLATSSNQPVEPIVEPAHDAADDSNGPVKIGGRASTSLPAAVADGDRVNAYFDENGQLHVVLGAGTAQVGNVGHGKTLKQVVVAPSTSGDSTAIASVAGKKLTVYGLVITTKADISAGLTIKFTDGVSGTTLWEADAMVPSTQSWGVAEAVTPPGHLFQGSAGTALVVNLSAAKACKVSLAYWEE